MNTLARRIYHRIRTIPVLGGLLVALRQAWLHRGNRAFQAVDWAQAREMGSVQNRLEVLEALVRSQGLAIQGLGSSARTLHQQLEQVAGSTDAMQPHGAAIDANAARIEFVRDEIMFELRKALKIKPAAVPGSCSEAPRIQPRILEHVQLDVQQPLRLNLGCGHKPHPDKLNVDVRELPGVDIVAGVDELPFDSHSVDCIYAAHLLEHFPRRYLLDTLLPYWQSLLKPGGSLQLVVPDSQAMLAAHQRGEIDFATLAEVTFGKQDYEGDFHYAMYSPDSLIALLQEAGFEHVRLLASDRINGDCREMEVEARIARS